MNTGGIRAPLETGDVTYEELFRVIPFNNHGVVIGPISASTLLMALARSAQSCGDFGALMQSGLKVQIEKDCDPPSGHVGTATNARLTHVETLGGKVLLDTAAGVRPTAGGGPMLAGATPDLPAARRPSHDLLKGAPPIQNPGIFPEAL